MLKSMVREALVTSVTWLSPWVSFQMSQLSTVPKASLPASARWRAPGTFSSSQLSLLPEKYASGSRPVLAWIKARVAVGFERVAEAGGAAILPDDRVVDGLAGLAIPEHGRLALVGDADGGDVALGEVGVGEGFCDDAALRGPDFFGAMLDPARLRKYLGEGFLRYGDDFPGGIDHQRAGACCALIERKNVLFITHKILCAEEGSRADAAPMIYQASEPRTRLVEDLQAELDDARSKGAADRACGGGRAADDASLRHGGAGSEDTGSGGALRAADRGGRGCRDVEVGVVEEVVELGAELHLEALDRGGELLVEREVGLVESGVRAGLRVALPKGLRTLPAASAAGGRIKALGLM